MEVMIDRDRGHNFSGSKAWLIRNRVKIDWILSHDKTGIDVMIESGY